MESSADAVPRLAEFHEQGFTILRGFFAAQQARSLIGLIEEAGPDPARRELDRPGLSFYSNVYRRSAALRAFLAQSRVVSLVSAVAGPDLWLRWDQAVRKTPGGAEFPWHQDNGYTRLPVAHYQFWVALSRNDPEHGGLWVVPGSHRRGLLPHRAARGHQVYEGPADGAVAVLADPGDVVLFSSYLLHATSPNRCAEERWAYVAEFMSLEDRDPGVEPPYFIVASGGEPRPGFVDRLPARAAK